MPIAIELTWDNAKHPLLSSVKAGVIVDYPPNPPPFHPPEQTTREGGVRFDVPGNPDEVELVVSVQSALPAKTIKERHWRGRPIPRIEFDDKTAPAVKASLLDAHQIYQVRGNQLVPTASLSVFGGAGHPLLSPPKTGTDGVVSIRLLTDFTDVTKLWMNRAVDSAAYTSLHEKGSRLVALGSPDPRGPLFWFAVVPDICISTGSVSCVVFFRPTGHYEYTSLDDNRLDMYPLSRYLIRPRASLNNLEKEAWAFDRFFNYEPIPGVREVYRDLCAGMEQALVDSKKSAILLIPWPSGANFGAAANVQLPDFCAKVLRLLWSKGFVGKGTNKVSLNRLALAGFSSGSGQLFQALGRNSEFVSEVYAFDCDKMEALAERARAWAKVDQHRLRMTGGYDKTVETNHALRERLVNDDGKSPMQVTAVPANSTTDWAEGANPWWDYVTSSAGVDKEKLGALRAFGPIRHQFAMFGGIDPSRMRTYFADFLNGSSL
jgi:hypothetical protein